ncbi:hypothetical protein SAMN04488028_101171 [Reichenbachiella agariperforans]|uniref:Uncharacterized protein n=2 Tax=Reichenbachiella agariperforans TaxID=156994 RepID=A0A1M6JFC6_REIAG|nr:hypothetical protein SAMN04488028_101171 [Reichenbachiella agariperforans]
MCRRGEARCFSYFVSENEIDTHPNHLVMKSYLYCAVLAVVLASCIDTESRLPEEEGANVLIEEQLLQNSQKMIEAAKTKSFAKISNLYDKEAMLMAEYNPLITTRDNIKVYYEEIFGREDVKTYTRALIDTLVFEDRVIEIGLFTKVLDSSDVYRGKYFNVWKRDSAQHLTLLAEAFGYLHQVEAPSPLVVHSVAKAEVEAITIPWELEAYNALNETNVIDRIPEKSANAYSVDAMYLPFADTIQSGRSVLVQHYQDYYRHPAKIDSIQVIPFAVDTVDNGYIRYAGFYVDWSVPGFSGSTAGTGISYWRREEDRSLRIHRQIGLHIHRE